MSWIPLAVLLAVAFGARLVPRLLVPRALGSDTYYHLAMARSIRENGMRPEALQPRSVIELPHTYPFLYHWLLAWLPPRGMLAAEGVSSALCDAALVVVTYATAALCAAWTGVPDPGAFALWAAALVAFSPGLLRVSSGPRAYRGTPRTLGQLWYGVYLGALVLHHLQPHPGLLGVAAVSSALLCITSKFGNQVVLLGGALLLAAGYPAPLLTALAGWAAAIALTGGRAWRVLRGQVLYSAYYFRYLQRRYLVPETPGLLGHLRSLAETGGRPRALTHWLLMGRHPLHLLVVAFWPLPAALLLLARRPEPPSEPLGAALWFTLTLSLVGAGLMFLIKLRPLLFLGEPERYLEFMALPQALLVALVCFGLDRRELLYGFAGYAALVTPAFLYLAVRAFRKEQRLHDDLLPLLEGVDRDGARVYPLGAYWWALQYGTRRCRVLVPVHVDHTIPGAVEQSLAAFGDYPFPTVPLAELASRFELDFLVTHTDALRAFEERIGAPAFAGLSPRLIDERGGYRTYDLRAAASEEAVEPGLEAEQ